MKSYRTFHASCPLLCLTLLASSCGPSLPDLKEYVRPSQYELVVKTDFEGDATQGMPADAHDTIEFSNLVSPLESNLPIPDVVTMPIFYEDGDARDRYARLVPDPVAPGNQVLQYWLRNASIAAGYQSHNKARIQVGINPEDVQVGLPQIYAKRRVYLHPDLGLLTSYPEGADTWWLSITLEELWFGAGWKDHPAHARISLSIVPDMSAGVLRLSAGCDTTSDFEKFWESTNMDFELPLGEWLTVETGYSMGDADSGRFKVVVDADSFAHPVTVIDVTDHTYNPHADEMDAVGPIALSHWQPMKFYTSDNVAHHIRDQGGVAQVYWDDFEFAETWPADWEE